MQMGSRNKIVSVIENTQTARRWRGAVNGRNLFLVPFGVAILLLCLSTACVASAVGGQEEICDVTADYALGLEDYPEAISLHREVVRQHPDDALAHYHLGFAEGMMGDKRAELREYQLAATLGLRTWDLFLNIGVVQLENGELDAATDSLQQAVLLGPNHSESHYNLALAFARRGLLADAEREILASLRLEPGEPDERNMLAVIYAQEGKTARATLIWRELVHEVPAYEPARTNLALLGSQASLPLARRRPLRSRATVVKTVEDERN